MQFSLFFRGNFICRGRDDVVLILSCEPVPAANASADAPLPSPTSPDTAP